MDRIDHPTAVDIGDGRRGFRSKDTVAGVPGTVVTATHLNAKQEEIVRAIELSGRTPDRNILTQLAASMRSQRMNKLVAGGTANAVTLATDLAFDDLADLIATPLRWIAAATNTGAMTLKVGALVADDLTWPDGTAMAAGDIETGALCEALYDGTAFRLFNCLSPTFVRNLAVPIPSSIVVFAASGTYTKPANLVAAKVTMVGAGGAGGVGDSGGYWGGGGGAGAEVNAFFLAADLGATEAVTVGAGAPSVPPSGLAGGTAGGNTQFRNMIAGGGQGGGTASAAHGASGTGGTFTIAGPGIGIGIAGGNGPFGARWDTPSSKGAIGRGGSPGSFSFTLGGSGGTSGIVIIEEYRK